ncbi:helix-turn-helix domain-containing protein [Streptomyces sp. SL13]|uniref:Helix-turn-helix domain-containing protein n=1 Tax=Streptantibioticus silvisoli TaxID=2705255 RepID=A0AA90HBQ0_9ACTN|nr:helix-turn-helix domain-containing protein [Streptantibioticus silvisoli]MDI5971872.1 helix-turn-helix domain-containing protein [Streptantibioticus silvisoli]
MPGKGATVATARQPKLLRLPEVLAELDMSRAAFYRMRARGKGPRVVKLPTGGIRIRRADLDAWLATCEELAA